MSKFIDNTKRQAEENPALAIGLGVGALGVFTKLLTEYNKAKANRTWAKEVNRRTRNDNRN